MITVTLDEINTMVLKVAMGILNFEPQYAKSPTGAAILKKTYAENSPPNSIISEARKTQIPNLELFKPVSGLSSTMYGICTVRVLYFSVCGEKSLSAPGTLYS